MSFIPDSAILDAYAAILINFGLNGGRGVGRGEVVFLEVPEVAKPLLISLNKAVLKAGAHPIIQFIPDGLEPHFFEHASGEQVSFFPAKFLKGKIREADHLVKIITDTDLHELEGVDPQKILQKYETLKPYIDWRYKKEIKGKFSWTLGLFPTKAMAREAGMSLRSAWKQVIKACYLDTHNPVYKWTQIDADIKKIVNRLNHLPVSAINIRSAGTDLTIGMDRYRRWLSGGGNNIPSFEIFTSPDCRQTEGCISFDLPLYRYGNLIKDIYLEFRNGRIVSATASKGESVLKRMIASPGADMVGEFSLTDIRYSRIDRFMAETLYDENFGGLYGNTHIALGMSFHEAYRGQAIKLKSFDWKNLGFNDSAVHTDIISTKNRTVTALFENGSTRVIYQNGKFTI